VKVKDEKKVLERPIDDFSRRLILDSWIFGIGKSLNHGFLASGAGDPVATS